MEAIRNMTQVQKDKINMAIKNGNDISDLIEGWNISGMYLASAKISRFNRVQENMTNINFVGATIGEEGKITNLCGSNFMGSNFQSAKFLGKIWFRGCDLRNCNFNNAWLPEVEYQRADLRNIQLCDAVFRIGSKSGFGAKLEWKLFEQLAQYLELDIQK